MGQNVTRRVVYRTELHLDQSEVADRFDEAHNVERTASCIFLRVLRDACCGNWSDRDDAADSFDGELQQTFAQTRHSTHVGSQNDKSIVS